MKMEFPVTIVIAWLRDDVRHTGQWGGRYGDQPEVVPVKLPVACVWVNRGEAADLDRARAHAAEEGAEVFTFPVTEKQPLELARGMMEKAHV